MFRCSVGIIFELNLSSYQEMKTDDLKQLGKSEKRNTQKNVQLPKLARGQLGLDDGLIYGFAWTEGALRACRRDRWLCVGPQQGELMPKRNAGDALKLAKDEVRFKARPALLFGLDALLWC